jgi:nitrogen fixation NifU-like protein
MQLDELYQEVILDHYKRPRCHGCLTSSNAQASLYNPLCGDQIQLTVALDAQDAAEKASNTISDLGFAGHGCSISQASASMMAEVCKGKSVEEAKELIQHFRDLMRGARTGDESPELGDAVALEGVRKFSARVKCAMLAWEALEKCLESKT